MKRKITAIVLAITLSCHPVLTYGTDMDIFSDSEESFNKGESETNILTDEDNSDIIDGNFDDSSENLNEEEISEFSSGVADEIWSDGSDEQQTFSAESKSNTPEYDTWLSDTILSGLKIDGSVYGNSMYELFKQMQDPIYSELGALLLDDVPMMSISSVWNDVIKKNFYDNQKLVYETMLMEYIKYENKSSASSFDTSQIDRANSYLIKIFDKLADKYLDEGVQNWSPDKFMDMSVEDAVKSFENLEEMQKTIKMVKNAAKTTRELLKLSSELSALNDAKQQKIQLIKNARNASAAMTNPNKDFISACDEITGQMESTVVDINYLVTQGASAGMDKLISTVWGKLAKGNPVLESIDLGADAMDILFNTSDGAANNLKLALLYTMDCYLKMGLGNASLQYMNNKNDNEKAQTFSSCFQGYIDFQIYGNHVARSWISSVTDGGALNHVFTYIFYRENLKNAEELKKLCDSQNNTRNQILNIIVKYQNIYNNLYMKDEYKQAMSVTITPAPALKPEDYRISDGITSPNPVQKSGKCGDTISWKFFKDGTLIIYGTGDIRWKSNILNDNPWRNEGFCGEIKDVKITQGITAIGDYSFYDAVNLRTVDIPDSVTEIGSYAFGYCRNLREIKLSDHVNKIGESAFRDCQNLETADISQNITYLPGYVFYGCSSLRKIELPNKIQRIDRQAFESCSSLISLKITENVKFIRERAFAKCSSLQKIEVPATVEELNSTAFDECTSLKSAEIETTTCPSFDNCNSLEMVTAGANLNSYNGSMFSNCANFKQFIVKESNPWFSADKNALYNKNGTELLVYYKKQDTGTFTVPDGVETVGPYAFYNCKLNSIVLSDSVTDMKCSLTVLKNLESITIGSGLRSYITGIENLKNVILSEKNPYFSTDGFSFFDKNKRYLYCYYKRNIQRSYTVPETVKTIGSGAFNSCNKLETINLPNGLVEIGSRAFYGCSGLKEMSIPESVLSISEGAFWADNLKIIKIYGNAYLFGKAMGYDKSGNKLQNFTVNAKKGTNSEKYAKDNGFKFVELKTNNLPDKITLSLSKTSLVYNGKAQTPSVTVKYKGKKLSGKYYTVKYINNKKVGIATVLVIGKGIYKNYSGKASFKIILKSGNISELKAEKKSVSVKWSKISGSAGYQLQYSTSKNFSKSKTVKISGTAKNKQTIKNLSSQKTYYVRVRAYKTVNGKTWYGAWSKSKNCCVK